MTLGESLVKSLKRVGLSSTSSIFVDQARIYWNEGAISLSGERQWKWLFKVATLTTVATQRSYSLAADVYTPLSFIHTTDDRLMSMIDVQDADARDPNMDDTGDTTAAYITGINTTTGYWEVDLVDTPDTSSETITYRYYGFIVEKTSSADSTDLAGAMPRLAQEAVVDYVAARYKGEKGDARGEQEEMDAYDLKVKNLKRMDGDTDGNESTRLPRRDSNGTVTLRVNGTLG